MIEIIYEDGTVQILFNATHIIQEKGDAMRIYTEHSDIYGSGTNLIKTAKVYQGGLLIRVFNREM